MRELHLRTAEFHLADEKTPKLAEYLNLRTSNIYKEDFARCFTGVCWPSLEKFDLKDCKMGIETSLTLMRVV